MLRSLSISFFGIFAICNILLLVLLISVLDTFIID